MKAKTSYIKYINLILPIFLKENSGKKSLYKRILTLYMANFLLNVVVFIGVFLYADEIERLILYFRGCPGCKVNSTISIG